MGASNHLFRMGTWSLLNLLGSQFKGPIYIVHPKNATVQGIKTYKDIDSLPEIPDLLVLVIPTTIVPDVLEQAGEKGIKRAVVITAGYNEVGKEGKSLQKKIDRVVEKYGIRYIGPNCIGVVNAHMNLNSTPFSYEGRKGGIGLASHSGSYVCHVLGLAEELDLGIAEWISLGNEGNIDVVEALDYFRLHPDINVVGLYLEGIRRPRAFKEAALKLAREKPVVALYTGGTEEGARSAASHTAAISSPGNTMEGFLRQCGIILARTSHELYEWLNAFERQPLPGGPRVAILANSGGPATSAADHIGKSTLELNPFSKELAEKIGQLLPHTASGKNPIDLTFSPDQETFFQKLPQLLIDADEVDAVIIYGIFGIGMPKRLLTRAFGEIHPDVEKMMVEATNFQSDLMSRIFKNCGKPVLGASFDIKTDPSVRRMMHKGNIPFYRGPEQSVRALEALWQYKLMRDQMWA